MADTASPILLQRIQSVGSNVNTWGGYINTDLQMLEQAAKGYQSLAVTGDATISWTNYTLANTGSCARLKLTGSPSAAATLTFPAYMNFLSVDNTTAQTITIKCSGGTGVAVPASQKMLIYCDGVDYYNASATIGPTQTQSTNTYAFAQWGAVQTAIAAAALPATAGTQLVSGTDTTAGYTSQKFTTSYGSLTTTQIEGLTSLELSVENSGANEKLKITAGQGYVGGFLNGGVKSSAFTPSQGNGYDVDCSSAGFTVDLSSMTSVQVGQEIQINKFGSNSVYFKGTVNGTSNLSLGAFFNQALRYCGSSWGWNLMVASVKSIQRGTITMNGVNTNTATITSVDTSKSEIFLLGWSGPASGDGDYQPRISLTDGTTVTANRTGTNNVTTLNFQVTEHY